jgi:hypothetical protein
MQMMVLRNIGGFAHTDSALKINFQEYIEPTSVTSHISAPAPRSIPAKIAPSSSPDVAARTRIHIVLLVPELVYFG